MNMRICHVLEYHGKIQRGNALFAEGKYDPVLVTPPHNEYLFINEYSDRIMFNSVRLCIHSAAILTGVSSRS